MSHIACSNIFSFLLYKHLKLGKLHFNMFFSRKMKFFQLQALVQQKWKNIRTCYMAQKMRLSLYLYAHFELCLYGKNWNVDGHFFMKKYSKLTLGSPLECHFSTNKITFPHFLFGKSFQKGGDFIKCREVTFQRATKCEFWVFSHKKVSIRFNFCRMDLIRSAHKSRDLGASFESYSMF